MILFERDKLARPYAKALFEIAAANKAYLQWSEILRVLSEISKTPKVVLLLADATNTKERLINFYFQVAGSILNEEAKNLIRILANKNRLRVLPQIAKMFEHFYHQHENTVEVELTTAVPLTLEQEQALATKLKKVFVSNIIMKSKVDKAIIGGFIARAGNRVLDSSLQGQIVQLKDIMGE
jgi:F-type H+-transporting ATPase subunit delta